MLKKIISTSLLVIASISFTTSYAFAANITDINNAVENSRHLLEGETFTLDQPCRFFNDYNYKLYHCQMMIAPLALVNDKTLAATKTSDNLLHRQISFIRKEGGFAIFKLLPISTHPTTEENDNDSNDTPPEVAKKQLSFVGFNGEHKEKK
ncbi:hypothetical protein GRJ22_02830 [Photobacterium carnosum]|uniref:hypothetical protein n=1 Tax=Photobacterium carnosum TaxID=2023717 RepID=UPI001E5C2EEF|nr:hypothetical protein [Photobacterium carnosum]MCD9536348.1 hypothetical protein [Photobacterium carnosum]MCD9540017.1 hypothetical protein [Photobacterium carnosum]MCD9555385.1 hypothetical protein [Photobacterium carnosum]MCF2160736.1 hypothetical protein [Photobacterium carnosum]